MMIIKTIETFKTNKTIKMATDNAVIPDLVMVLTVLIVLTVLTVLMVLMVLRYNRKGLNTPSLNNPLMIQIDRFVLNFEIIFLILQKN